MDKRELLNKIWKIYMGNSKIGNVYADQADDEALIAVYEAGIDEGIRRATDD